MRPSSAAGGEQTGIRKSRHVSGVTKNRKPDPEPLKLLTRLSLAWLLGVAHDLGIDGLRSARSTPSNEARSAAPSADELGLVRLRSLRGALSEPLPAQRRCQTAPSTQATRAA
jgi:hypothetical protein